MRVIFTGQSGVNKDMVVSNLINYLEESCGQSENRNQNEQKPFILHKSLEEKLLPNQSDTEHWDFIDILNVPSESNKTARWYEALSNLIAEVEDQDQKNVFINMHAVIYIHSNFSSHSNWDLVRKFRPDMIVTLVDDIYDIWWFLKKRREEYPQNPDYRLREIMTWRTAEFMAAELLAQNLHPDYQIPHYVVANKQPVNTLVNLLLHPEKMRVYASFPITEVRNNENDKETIDSHRKYLHDRYVTFDPLTIDEYVLSDKYYKWIENGSKPSKIAMNSEDRWQVRSDACDLPLLSEGIDYPDEVLVEPEEIEEVAYETDELMNHVEWRDYRLIEQSHCLAAYRPKYKGIVSRGSSAEVDYAQMSVKPMYLYWKHLEDGRTVPFGSGGKVSYDYNEFLENLEKHQERITEKGIIPSHKSSLTGC